MKLLNLLLNILFATLWIVKVFFIYYIPYENRHLLNIIFLTGCVYLAITSLRKRQDITLPNNEITEHLAYNSIKYAQSAFLLFMLYAMFLVEELIFIHYAILFFLVGLIAGLYLMKWAMIILYQKNRNDHRKRQFEQGDHS
jgi:hypothetical protein